MSSPAAARSGEPTFGMVADDRLRRSPEHLGQHAVVRVGRRRRRSNGSASRSSSARSASGRSLTHDQSSRAPTSPGSCPGTDRQSRASISPSAPPSTGPTAATRRGPSASRRLTPGDAEDRRPDPRPVGTSSHPASMAELGSAARSDSGPRMSSTIRRSSPSPRLLESVDRCHPSNIQRSTTRPSRRTSRFTATWPGRQPTASRSSVRRCKGCG